jgi:UDP-N-acetylmuramoylalanine--D-glutamate ligase
VLALRARGAADRARRAKLCAAIEPSGVPCFDLTTCREAVRRAAGLARAGDSVLLSPACASLDMFTNYAHRAQVFVDAVREIALEKGQEI